MNYFDYNQANLSTSAEKQEQEYETLHVHAAMKRSTLPKITRMTVDDVREFIRSMNAHAAEQLELSGNVVSLRQVAQTA